jgi:hypothetical protein
MSGFLDVSTTTIESALTPLGVHLSCDLCRQALKERVENLVAEWSAVKVRDLILNR